VNDHLPNGAEAAGGVGVEQHHIDGADFRIPQQ
jgi:hypothetical protein